MKKILIILWILFLSLNTKAQSPVDKLFDKYAEKDGFTTIVITQYMFDMFKSSNTSDKEFDDLVRNLKSIRILTVGDKKNVPAGINFFKEIMKELPVQQYKELMAVKEKDQQVKFLVKENSQGRIAELLLITGGEDNVLICIQGDIDMKSLSKLSKNLNIGGMKSLEKMDKKAENKK